MSDHRRAVAAEGASGGDAGRRRRWPVYALLVGAWPALFLWSRNATEAGTGEALELLAWAVGGTVVTVAIAALVLRDLSRGALVGAVAAFVFQAFGHLGGDRLSPAAGVTVCVLAVAAVAVAAARAGRPTLAGITRIANVVGLVLVLMTLPAIVTALQSGTARAQPGVARIDATGEPARDIWYIVPDRYGRRDSLRESFGYDNADFVRFLEDAGFQVAERALANYPKTAHSLASSLNLDYAADLLPDEGLASDDWKPVYGLLADHRLGRTLTAAGYQYVHLGSWWQPTKTSVDADVTLGYDGRSELASVYEQTTLLPAIRALAGDDGETSRLEFFYNSTMYQLGQLDRLARERRPGDAPRFVFAHLTIPHEPYVVASDGSFVSEAQDVGRTREERFNGQLDYLNRRLRTLVETLLAGPDASDPVVVIQADEGPHVPGQLREGASYNWVTAPLDELELKLQILSALYLPSTRGGVPVVPEDITAVNTFRLVLDAYLGTDLGPLPDRAYVFTDERHLYDFHDVTDRLR